MDSESARFELAALSTVKAPEMSPEEERRCWASYLWVAAAKGDPTIIWGPATATVEAFGEACRELQLFTELLRSIHKGNIPASIYLECMLQKG